VVDVDTDHLQELRYGGDDPGVVSAVGRLATQIGRVAQSEYDREMAASLTRTVDAHTVRA